MVEQKTSLNTPKADAIRAHSNFADGLKYQFAATYRFGEIAPHFSTSVVPDENRRFSNSHRLRSYTLSNPLMQSLYMHKDYYFIPEPCIIPINYEKFRAIPNRGSDVVPTAVGTTVDQFWKKLSGIANAFIGYAKATPQSGELNTHTRCFRFIVWLDMMYSRGSLMKYLGCTPPWNSRSDSPDSIVNAFWDYVSTQLQSSGVELLLKFGISSYYYIGKRGSNVNYGLLSLREAISRMRDDFSFVVHSATGITGNALTALLPSTVPGGTDDAPCNLARAYAYQMLCAHWYSNDKIDAIYTAELYRQLIRSTVGDLIGSGSSGVDATFTYNGVSTYYDSCSAYMFDQVYYLMTGAGGSSPDDTSWQILCDYCRLVFGFNRSLRYGDYFTGSRTNPIAPGNVNVTVNNNLVNVVESIQTSWFARLLSNVARMGHKLSNQLKGFNPGVDIVQDWHEPIWLGSTEFDVFADEVDNTGAAQMSDRMATTAYLRSYGEKVAFSMNVPDKYGEIIGVTYFDIMRFYANAIERTFFHKDRYDGFQSFLQFDGDQPVYRKEIQSSFPLIGYAFGYQGNYMEYKQRFNQAAGGFAEGVLPGMVFIADEGRDSNDFFVNSSDYIRSYPSELDRFYNQLSGYSLATYFHFIIINENYDDANKPMVYNPQLD